MTRLLNLEWSAQEKGEYTTPIPQVTNLWELLFPHGDLISSWLTLLHIRLHFPGAQKKTSSLHFPATFLSTWEIACM